MCESFTSLKKRKILVFNKMMSFKSLLYRSAFDDMKVADGRMSFRWHLRNHWGSICYTDIEF